MNKASSINHPSKLTPSVRKHSMHSELSHKIQSNPILSPKQRDISYRTMHHSCSSSDTGRYQARSLFPSPPASLFLSPLLNMEKNPGHCCPFIDLRVSPRPCVPLPPLLFPSVLFFCDDGDDDAHGITDDMWLRGSGCDRVPNPRSWRRGAEREVLVFARRSALALLDTPTDFARLLLALLGVLGAGAFAFAVLVVWRRFFASDLSYSDCPSLL